MDFGTKTWQSTKMNSLAHNGDEGAMNVTPRIFCIEAISGLTGFWRCNISWKLGESIYSLNSIKSVNSKETVRGQYNSELQAWFYVVLKKKGPHFRENKNFLPPRQCFYKTHTTTDQNELLTLSTVVSIFCLLHIPTWKLLAGHIFY